VNRGLARTAKILIGRESSIHQALTPFHEVAGLVPRMSVLPDIHVRDNFSQTNHGLEIGPWHVKGLEWRSLKRSSSRRA
jgi:hypothetical protein